MRSCGGGSAESVRARPARSQCATGLPAATTLKTLCTEHVSLAKWEAFGGWIRVMQPARRSAAFT